MPTPEAEARVEIEQDHIDRAQAIAGHLAGVTTLGRVAGEDELKSEALVALWDLAMEYDPDTGVPFTAFISLRMRFRLIDYLRNTYGRERQDGSMSPKMEALLGMTSLDTMREDEEHHATTMRQHPALIDPRPSVEETVLDRDELQRLGAYLRSGELTNHQLRSLMWPVYDDGTPEAYVREAGKTKMNISVTRKQAKQKAAEHLGRELKPNHYSPRMRRWLLHPNGAPADQKCEGSVTVMPERPVAAVVNIMRPTVMVKTRNGSVTEMDGRRKSKHTLAKVDDDQLLEDRRTMTLQEIGNRYGVSASAVCHRLRKMGKTKERPRYSDLIPWRVAMEHSDELPVEALRALGAYRAGKTLDRYAQGLVERFVQRMVAQNLVIDYTREDGFREVPRSVSDIGVHPYYEQALMLGSATRLAG